jgi:hypothetical protein
MLLTENLFLIHDAARYLGMSVANMKYHLYDAQDLTADGTIGRYLVFTKDTLDTFRQNKRSPGRPRNTPTSRKP